jgi:CRP-like cAMP-binding protein
MLWQIDTGVVRTLTFSNDGEAIPLGLWSAGDIVGQPLIHSYPCQIECLVDVKAHYVDFREVESLNKVMLSHIYQMENLLQIRSGQVPQRLWQLLKWLAYKFGSQTHQGHLIELRLTHQDIADLIGTTRVTVTRLIHQFEQEGIISRLGRRGFLWHCSSWF